MAIALTGTAVKDSGTETAPVVDVVAGTVRKLLWFSWRNGNASVSSVSTGWSILAQSQTGGNNGNGGAVIASDADTADTTCTVTLSAAPIDDWSSISRAITDWDGTFDHAVVSATLDCPNLTGLGTATKLIVPLLTHEDGRREPSGYPETADNDFHTSGASATGAVVSICSTTTTATSYDPGAFTVPGTIVEQAWTLAFHETQNTWTGSGTPTFEDVASSGSGTFTWVGTGSGTPTLEDATSSGSGTHTAPPGTYTGSGSPTFEDVASSGTGTHTGVTGQTAFRIRDDSTALNTDGGWLAAENTNLNVPAEEIVRIRFQVTGALNVALKAQYRRNGGAWTDWTVEADPLAQGIYPKTLVSGPSAQFADAAAITSALLTTATGTFVNGLGDEASNAIAAVNIGASEYTEYELAFLIHKFWDDGSDMQENPDGTTFELRLVESDGTPLPSYNQTPTLTVESPYLLGGCHAETATDILIADGNGNLYYWVESHEHGIAGSRKRIYMLKSSDGGVTWSIVDKANSPNTGDDRDNDTEALGMRKDPNTTGVVQICHHDSNDTWYHRFRTSDHATNPDTWDVTHTLIEGTRPAPAMQGGDIAIRSDGDLIAFYSKGGTNDSCHYKVSTNGGTTWGTEQDLDGTSGETHRSPWTVMGENDLLHIFYIAEAGTDDAIIVHKTLDSSDVLTTDANRDVIEAGPLQTGSIERNPIFGVIYYDDAGVEVVGVAYLRKLASAGGERYAWMRYMRDGTLQTARQISDGTRDMLFGTGGSSSATGHMVNDGDTVHVLYREEITAQIGAGIWWDQETDEGGWGTDVEVQPDPGIDSGWIKATVFTHAAGNGGAKVLGYVYDKGTASTGGGQGPIYYAEEVLAAGTFTGSGTPTLEDVTSAGSGTHTAPTYTGSGTPTFEDVASAGTGTFTPETFTGSGTPTLEDATSAGVATFTAPTYTGSGTPVLEDVVSSGTGTHTPPTFTGSGTPAFEDATSAGSGTFTAPVYTGTGTPALEDVTSSGTGTHIAPVYTGTGAPALEDIVSTGTGTHSGPGTVTGSGAITFEDVTSAGTATFTWVGTGSGTPVFEGVTSSGTGTHVAPTFTGSGTPVLENTSSSGAATFTAPIYTGTGTPTFDDITSAGVATFTAPVYTGSGSPTFDNITSSGVGTFSEGVTGSGTPVFEDVTSAGSATFTAPTYTGTGTPTLEDIDSAGSGSFATWTGTGSGSPSFENITSSGVATFTVPVYTGTGTPTLDDISSVGTGQFIPLLTGSGSIQLEPVTSVGVATARGVKPEQVVATADPTQGYGSVSARTSGPATVSPTRSVDTLTQRQSGPCTVTPGG